MNDVRSVLMLCAVIAAFVAVGHSQTTSRVGFNGFAPISRTRG